MSQGKYKIIKLRVFILLAFFISIIFTSCEDKSYFKQIYNKKLFQEKVTCLNLKLRPYNTHINNSITSLYNFNEQCEITLQIRYKTNIACNSPYSTNKSFHSFVELSLIKDNTTYYTLYKDLKDEDIVDEIKKSFHLLQDNVTFK